jgi:SPOR domain
MICAEASRQRIEPTCAVLGGAAKRYGRKCRVVTQACRIEHIANAKHPHARLHGASESLNALATADSSTESVQIGDKVFYRARFTGFDKKTAATACQQLGRSDMSCFVLRN